MDPSKASLDTQDRIQYGLEMSQSSEGRVLYREGIQLLLEEFKTNSAGIEMSRLQVELPLQVVFPSSASGTEISLIEKIIQTLPFKIPGWNRVEKPEGKFFLDFTGQFKDGIASVDISGLAKSPELKKKLWADLNRSLSKN